MLSKLLSDSKGFFATAKREWDEASRLAKEADESEDERPADAIVLHVTENQTRIAIESALTVAAMNYTTSMELMLKGFIGVDMCFNESALEAMKKVGHKSQKVLGCIPKPWKTELERLYAASNVADIEIGVFWNWWNPPQGAWIEDTTRLDCHTLKEFLQFLDQERMNVERYSFERFAGDDFRIKLAKYEELEVLHRSIEEFLRDEAKKTGWWTPNTRIVLTVEGKRSRISKVKFATSRDRFELDQGGRNH